jgi:phage FluMu protein Com
MKFLWQWVLRLISAGSPVLEGSERRFRCRKCFEVGFFHADPVDDTAFEPKCSKCGQVNRLFVPADKPQIEDSKS